MPLQRQSRAGEARQSALTPRRLQTGGAGFEALTGSGLAAAAGLTAYIPIPALVLVARFTSVVALPSGWAWLENGWVLGLLGVLLVVEVIADKVPAVDHINDVV